MSILIKPEPAILNTDGQMEDCIFCENQTCFWTEDIAINRPVCVVCSVSNNVSDIPNAKYNY
jgi:hypothetical protein